MRGVLVLVLVCGLCVCGAFGAWSKAVAPFTADLSEGSSGSAVRVLQGLANRVPGVEVSVDGEFGPATEAAVRDLQSFLGVGVSGVLDEGTAVALMGSSLLEDGYRDDGVPPAALGYKYKLRFSVHRNRSIEPLGEVVAANGSVLLQFRARLHGYDTFGVNPGWPHFSHTEGLNEFSSNGNTPSGLSEADLNSPEDEPKFYGPYPVNRVVRGLKGNAAFLVPLVRDGILVHTGEWEQYSNWKPPQPMPNSEGCIHAYPASIDAIYKTLTSQCNVTVNKNTGGKLPYPYKPQGLVSIQVLG